MEESIQQEPKRSKGIEIIAILSFLGSIVQLLVGISAFGLIMIFNPIADTILGFSLLISGFLWGILFCVLGILGIISAIGLWNLKKWAFIIIMLLQIFALVFNILTVQTINIIIAVIIIGYLMVKRKLFS